MGVERLKGMHHVGSRLSIAASAPNVPRCASAGTKGMLVAPS